MFPSLEVDGNIGNGYFILTVCQRAGFCQKRTQLTYADKTNFLYTYTLVTLFKR